MLSKKRSTRNTNSYEELWHLHCTAIMSVVVACKHGLYLGESQEVTLEKYAKGNVSVMGGERKLLFPVLLSLGHSLMACFTHHKWRAC